MKVINIPINVLVHTDTAGKHIPLKFETEIEGEKYSVKIDKVISIEVDMFKGSSVKKYVCQCSINNVIRIIEIKYNANTMQWTLFKM